MIRKRLVFVIVPALLILAAVVLSLTNDKETSNSQVHLISFESSDLSFIEFVNGEEDWRLTNQDGWTVENSQKTDTLAVEQLLKNILRIDGKLIAETVQGEDYGLMTPAATVTFTEKNGDKTILRVGNKTPAGTEYYIADESGRIYTVYTDAGNALKSKRYQAEDSFILGVRYEELHQILVGGEMPFTLTKGKESWSFVCGDYQEEIPVELIQSGVTRHFSAMYALSTQKVTEERKNNCGFEDSADTVTLVSHNGETHTIFIGGNEGDRTYIMADDNDEIYCVITDYFNFIQLYRESAM